MCTKPPACSSSRLQWRQPAGSRFLDSLKFRNGDRRDGTEDLHAIYLEAARSIALASAGGDQADVALTSTGTIFPNPIFWSLILRMPSLTVTFAQLGSTSDD